MSLKTIVSFLAWLVALLCGAASLSFCAVWGLDAAGLAPIWGVSLFGLLLVTTGLLGCWRLTPGAQVLTPRSAWRDRLRYRVGAVASLVDGSRFRPTWPASSFVGSWRRPQTVAVPVAAPPPVAAREITPVHSIVTFIKLPPRSVAAASPKEKARHAATK